MTEETNYFDSEFSKSIDGLKNNSESLSIYKLNEIAEDSDIRIDSGISELNRVLGGGIVAGSIVLIGGSPGIGKSTLLLQMCKTIDFSKNIVYISGEESKSQIKIRASRLKVDNQNISLIVETNIIKICDTLKKNKSNIDVIIVDSVQTMYDGGISSSAGSISQIKEVTLKLMQLSRILNVAVLLVGHITKDGSIAGPKVLEHMVDCVLLFQNENNGIYRVLRTIKNRFGSTNEIGVFEMSEKGLIEVTNPSQLFLKDRSSQISGSSVVCCMEGTRPILAEIQALVTRTSLAIPRRTSSGIDNNKLFLLIAVLEKRLSLRLSLQEIYVNVAGGIRIFEPSADLGIAVSIFSSLRDIVIPEEIVFIGEIGLGGEIRPVSLVENRVREVQKLGFKKCVVPYANRHEIKNIDSNLKTIELICIKNLFELVGIFN